MSAIVPAAPVYKNTRAGRGCKCMQKSSSRYPTCLHIPSSSMLILSRTVLSLYRMRVPDARPQFLHGYSAHTVFVAFIEFGNINTNFVET